MKSLTLFLQAVLVELADQTGCRTSAIRDGKTVSDRVGREGWSFLTITLPAFGKGLEKALDLEQCSPDLFTGFRCRGRTPIFMGEFMDLVFDRGSGRLLDNPSITAIWAIRQFTLMWAKILLPCSDARNAAAIEKYLECEKEVRESDRLRSPLMESSFVRVASLLWNDVRNRTDKLVRDSELIPRHGPGATADRLKGNLKWNQTEWTQRMEQVFPHQRYLASTWSMALAKLDHITILEPGEERPVKVTLVPKTLKTPRLIAIEPTAMQYMQQGLRDALEAAIESDKLMRNFVGSADQNPNREMARTGSLSGDLATLDLSEASDRVSNQLVRLLFRTNPDLAEGIEACRSRKADVFGKTIRLAKFASMGSALTFPVEMMVFATIVFVGIERGLSRPITRKDVESLVGQVRIYGDDIIVPVEYVLPVIQALEDFGLRVNKDKSFWSGKFRESCGKEYYGGEDVSIVRVRRALPTRREHSQEIVSAVSLSNQLFMAGLWRSATLVDNWLRRFIPMPVVAEDSPLLGRLSFLGVSNPQERWDSALHRPLVKGGVVHSNLPESNLDDYGALMKVFTNALKRDHDLPTVDSDHLAKAGRPHRVDIKVRWESPI